jgi:putative transposase
MPRLARAVFVGFLHHATQRGNRRESVYFPDADRAADRG